MPLMRWTLKRRRDPVLPVATDAHAPAVSPLLTSVVRAFWADVGFSNFPQQNVGAVDRCLVLNSQQIATMPLRYRHATDVLGYEPSWVHDPDPAYYPNGIGDAVFSVVWSIYARGEAFLWVTTRYETGHPRTWTVLDAATMQVEDEGGVRAYSSNGYDLDPRDVVHILRDPRGGLRGTSALAAWWASLESLAQAEAYAADVYASTGVNRVALRATQRIDREQAAQIQADWVEAVSRRLGAPAILPPNLELLEALTISPKELMLLESREWDTRQIAAAFGVPAILLNIPMTGALVYQNPQQLAELWWRTELMPRAVSIARALSRWLPRGHWVEFDPGSALRPDWTTSIDVATKAVSAGLLSQDEARAWVFDLPPLPADEAEEIFEEEGSHGSAEAEPSAEEVVIA